jgi:NADH:ubiquinone oxidoreductase subunit 6 (subunit J)
MIVIDVISVIAILGAIGMVIGIVVVVASGDHEREEEDRARRYFDEHGHWPDEEPDQPG